MQFPNFNKVIISAPFGNYMNFPGTTSTLGTFTHLNRGGMLYRLWRCALTLRYHWRISAWTNRLGLPNPGLESLPLGDYSDKIISIYGFNAEEWQKLALNISSLYRPKAVELNLSCPNVKHEHFIKDVITGIDILHGHSVPIIAKLPPVKWMNFAKPLFDYGVKMFHCCNTIPSPGGGISGKPLKQYSLWATEELKQRWGQDVLVIGGGGVSGPKDVVDYLNAGADDVAIGSALFNPFFWKDVELLASVKMVPNPLHQAEPKDG